MMFCRTTDAGWRGDVTSHHLSYGCNCISNKATKSNEHEFAYITCLFPFLLQLLLLLRRLLVRFLSCHNNILHHHFPYPITPFSPVFSRASGPSLSSRKFPPRARVHKRTSNRIGALVSIGAHLRSPNLHQNRKTRPLNFVGPLWISWTRWLPRTARNAPSWS